MTEPEQKLWYELRELKHQGYYFRRQVPIKDYIVDFACLKQKLIIELDGAQHNKAEHKAKDIKRDSDLVRAGYRILRVWNSEIYEGMNSVMDSIFVSLPLEGEVDRASGSVGVIPNPFQGSNL